MSPGGVLVMGASVQMLDIEEMCEAVVHHYTRLSIEQRAHLRQ